MKKFLILGLSLFMILSFASCAYDDFENEEDLKLATELLTKSVQSVFSGVVFDKPMGAETADVAKGIIPDIKASFAFGDPKGDGFSVSGEAKTTGTCSLTSASLGFQAKAVIRNFVMKMQLEDANGKMKVYTVEYTGGAQFKQVMKANTVNQKTEMKLEYKSANVDGADEFRLTVYEGDILNGVKLIDNKRMSFDFSMSFIASGITKTELKSKFAVNGKTFHENDFKTELVLDFGNVETILNNV